MEHKFKNLNIKPNKEESKRYGKALKGCDIKPTHKAVWILGLERLEEISKKKR